MKPRLFVASSVEGLSIAYAVHENLEHDVEATVWTHGVFKMSEYPVESLLAELNKTDFGVFVFSADDVVTIRHKRQDAVRDNVIFELGLFIGRLGRERCFMLVPRGEDKLHIPTDLIGLTPGKFDDKRQDGNLRAALGPSCNQIREAVQKLGTFISPQPDRQRQGTASPADYGKLEDEMPDLLTEMRKDLAAHPLYRDILLVNDRHTRVGQKQELFYYTYESIPNLESKFKILENRGLVQENSRGDLRRYRMSENFVAHLNSTFAIPQCTDKAEVADEPGRRKPKKCTCGRSMENIGTDPSQPPEWACRNPRCLDSVWHKDSKCPKCGKRPAEITDIGTGFTSFLCEDGHSFTTH